MQNETLKARLFTPGYKGRWGLPRIEWGPPGIGKSAQPEQVAHACGLRFITLISSIRDPSDFSGLPVPDGDRVRFLPPDWAIEANEGGPCVVMFDEITTCAPAVQAALLRVILEGAVGGYQLGSHVRFIAAANPVNMAAGGYDLAAPLANRFGHETAHAPEPEQWGSYMMGLDDFAPAAGPVPGEAAKIEAQVRAAWPAAFAKARGAVISYVKGQRDALFKMPDANSPAASGAWSSPRSVEMATRALAGSFVHRLSDDQRIGFVGSHAGQGFAVALDAFLANLDLPDAQELLDGNVDWTFNGRRLDQANAVITSCTAFAIGDKSKERAKRHERLWEILGLIAESHADLAMPAYAELKRAGAIDPTNRASTKVLAKSAPMARAAGAM